MTAFSSYGRAVMRALPVLLLVSFLFAALAYYVARRQGTTYEVYFSYIISLREREASEDYHFDGYYALQATDLFAATFARWLGAPETIVAAYLEAGLPLPGAEARQLADSVKAERTAPQLVQVTVRGRTPDDARSLAKGLREVMIGHARDYHDQGIPALRFSATPTNEWLGVRQLSLPVIGLSTFAFSLLMGVNALLFWESLRRVT